jgi:hypothetical protein
MTTIYTDSDLLKAYKQKRKIFSVFFIILIIYLFVCITLSIYFSQLPYKDSQQNLIKFIVFALTFIFISFSMPYMGIKYKRIRYYYKMLKNISEGINEKNLSIFDRVDKTDTRDFVDMHVLILKEWSEKRKDYFERKLYIDSEKPLPSFIKGDAIRYISHGNLMLEYEVTDKTSL